jgi:hypothetical protein
LNPVKVDMVRAMMVVGVDDRVGEYKRVKRELAVMISGIPVLAVPAFRNYTSFPATLILIK